MNNIHYGQLGKRPTENEWRSGEDIMLRDWRGLAAAQARPCL